jgi:hypothetical protein
MELRTYDGSDLCENVLLLRVCEIKRCLEEDSSLNVEIPHITSREKDYIGKQFNRDIYNFFIVHDSEAERIFPNTDRTLKMFISVKGAYT